MIRDSEEERERRNKEKEEEGGRTKKERKKEEKQRERGRRRKNKEREEKGGRTKKEKKKEEEQREREEEGGEGAEPEIMTGTVLTLTITIIPFSFLITSRPLSVSMGNTIKWLKFKITNIPPNTPDIDVR